MRKELVNGLVLHTKFIAVSHQVNYMGKKKSEGLLNGNINPVTKLCHQPYKLITKLEGRIFISVALLEPGYISIEVFIGLRSPSHDLSLSVQGYGHVEVLFFVCFIQ